jgi:hypothetical protein
VSSPGNFSSFLSRGDPMPESMRFYSCPFRGANRFPSACTFPDNKTGELVCARNTDGPLCALCLPGYFHIGAGCKSCADPENLPWAHISCAAALALVVLARVLYKKLRAKIGKGREEDAQGEGGGEQSRWQVTLKRLRPVVKQVISFYQVITLFGDVYHVPYPSLYLGFMSWFSAFNFDFAFVLRLECVVDFTWHSTMYVTLVMFAALAGIQFLLLVFMEARSMQRKEPPGYVKTAAKVIVVLTYGCYPSFSNTLFQAFNCQKVDGKTYLRHDFKIECESSAHQVAQTAAGLGIVVCSIGIPLMYLLVLQRHRNDLTDNDPTSDRSAEHLAFFKEDYKPKYWYWESIELARKLLLTGFAALWLPGTLMQVITSLFVCLVNIVMVSRCAPYCGHEHEGDDAKQKKSNAAVVNTFALQAVVMTFLALFGALLVKFNSGFISTGAVEQGYSFEALQWFLVGTAFCTGAFGFAILLGEAGVHGAFNFLQQAAENWMPAHFVAAGQWLCGCRALCHTTKSDGGTADPVAQMGVGAGKTSEGPLSLDAKTLEIVVGGSRRAVVPAPVSRGHRTDANTRKITVEKVASNPAGVSAAVVV